MAVYSVCWPRSVCYLWLTLLLCFSDLQLTVVCNLKLIVNPIAVSLLFTFILSDHTKSLLSSQSASPTFFFACIAHSFLYLHYLPPFRSSPLRHSQYDVLPGDRILYLLWVHKGGLQSPVLGLTRPAWGRVWRGMGEREKKNGGQSGECCGGLVASF